MNMHRVCPCLLLCFAPALFGQNAEDESKQLLQQAQEAAKSGKLDQAVALMKKAVELTPKNDLHLAYLADFEQKAGKYADGVEHAAAAIKLNDKVGAYYIIAAANAYGDQNLERAREFCDVLLKKGEKEFGAGPLNDVKIIQSLVYPKTYTLFWTLDPTKGRPESGAYAVAMPKNKLPYQSVSYEIADAQSSRLAASDINDILYVVPKRGKSVVLTMKIKVEPYSFKKELEKATPSKTIPADARAFLGSCEGINVTSPALRKVAAGLKGETNVETARNVLAWMKKNVEYKLEKSSIGQLDFKTVDDIIQRGHAECRGYSMLFTALCRAADVPARPIWGLVRVGAGQDRRFGDISSHNWAEFYVSGVGWVPVDPQKPETLGFLPSTCMRFFMDTQKTKTSGETLPVLNLLIMNGEKLRFEESK